VPLRGPRPLARRGWVVRRHRRAASPARTMKTKAMIFTLAAALILPCGICAQNRDPLNNWQLVATLPVPLRGLAFNKGNFVGVGYSTNIVVSTNGTNWSVVVSGLTQNYESPLAVAAGAGLFVAVGPGIGGTILTSPDGRQWTRRPTGAPSQNE